MGRESRRSFRHVQSGEVTQPRPGSGYERRLAASDLYEEMEEPKDRGPMVKDLKDAAREAGIEGFSSMNKKQLTDALATVPTAEGEGDDDQGDQTEEPQGPED